MSVKNRVLLTLWTIFTVSIVVPLTDPFLSKAHAALSAPTISSSTGQNGYAEVAFTNVSGATNYDYSTDGGITWTTRSPIGTWSPLSIYGLTNGTTYSIKIRARDASGPGSASLATTVTPNTRSVISGTQAFLQGKFVEIGVRNNGAFGSSTSVPSGFHPTVSPCLGFRVDRQKNGWGSTVGTSAPFTNIDDGDYFCPGTQYEGWALKVNGETTKFNNHGATAILGTNSNLVTNATEQKVDWTATSSSSGILVKQTVVVPNEGQSLHIDITLTNTSASSIPNIYYLRGYDPDNSTGNSTGSSNVSSSTNVVTVRGGTGVSAEVKSTFDSGAQVLLRSTDSRARAAANNSSDCCNASTAEPITVWNASSPFAQAVGSATIGDQQVALSVKVDSLAAGASTSFRISYVLTAEDANSPSVTTVSATNVDTSTSVTLNSLINPNGAATAVEFEYGTDSLLTSGYSTVSAGTITGSNATSTSIVISNLIRGSTYYFRAKGSNSVGTSYGSILSFTPIGLPLASIVAASSIGETTSVINASINAQGGTTREIIFVWSSDSNFQSDTRTVIASPSSITGNTTVSASANLSSLSAATTYYYKIKVVNEAGTTFSDSVSFTTTPAPSAITDTVTSITGTSAVLNGRVNARGINTTQIFFSYSTVSDLSSGVSTINTTPSQATGSNEISVSAALSNLITGTTYYVRLSAVNPNGSNSGEIRSFTPATSPVVTTDTATVTGTTATLMATVNPRGSSTTSLSFIYGISSSLTSDTATAVISPAILNGSTAQSVSKNITGLTPLTTYYYRIVAVNAIGSSLGSIQSFTTPFADVVSPSETLTAVSSSFSKIENILITITFSESVTGFTSADVSLGGTSASFYGKGTAQSVNGFTYTVLLSPSGASPGSLTISVPSGSVLDYAGNSNTVSNFLNLTIKNIQSTFTLTVGNGVYGTTIKAISSGGSGSGAVSYAAYTGTASGCAIQNSDSITSTSAGTCVVVATKSGDADYVSISDTKTVTFSKASRTISINSVGGVSSLIFGSTLKVVASVSQGSLDGEISFNVGSSTGCSIAIETLTAILGTGSCAVIASISEGVNYESATSASISISILKANQAKLTIGQYTAFVGVSTYPINVYGGSGTGAISRTLSAPGSANCTLQSGLFVQAASVGSCTITAVKAADTNYLAETATAAIYWVQWSDAYATRVPSVPTGIDLQHKTQITKYNYETLTVTSYKDGFGNPVTSITANSQLRIIGDGFNAADTTTEVVFGNAEIVDMNYSSPALQVVSDGSGGYYLLVTVPSGAGTDNVVVNSAKGTAMGPVLTIL